MDENEQEFGDPTPTDDQKQSLDQCLSLCLYANYRAMDFLP